MPIVLSTDVFAARGDAWDHDARRNPVPTGVVVREVRRPDGVVELDHYWENEGFGPDGEPVKVSQRWTCPSPERREVERSRQLVEQINETHGRKWTPEYRRVRDDLAGRHPDAKETPLTAEQQLIRKRQRAAVKARMTRAVNKLKAEKQEAWNILLSI